MTTLRLQNLESTEQSNMDSITALWCGWLQCQSNSLFKCSEMKLSIAQWNVNCGILIHFIIAGQ